MSARLALAGLLAVGSMAAAENPQTSTAPQAQPNSPVQAAHHRIHFGGIYVGAGYSYWSSGFPFYGYYPGYWYDPLLYPPVYAYGYYSGFAWQPNFGAIKIHGADKDAWVYLDGALAGRADKLKQIWLDPGTYDLELRGARTLTRKVYVLSGKTLQVRPEMMEAQP